MTTEREIIDFDYYLIINNGLLQFNLWYYFMFLIYSLINNRIGGVMISVLASSAVDRGFEPRSGQTKDYKNWYLLLLH